MGMAMMNLEAVSKNVTMCQWNLPDGGVKGPILSLDRNFPGICGGDGSDLCGC